MKMMIYFILFHLSTTMDSINKLSTIKSVFIVPINKNMTKIKIDFFIMPKSRSYKIGQLNL